jgi:hypothetical protein
VRRRCVAAPVLATALAVLGGCSSGDDGGSSAPPTVTAGTAATAPAIVRPGATVPTGATPGGPLATGPVVVCELLPAATVAAITALSISQAEEADTPSAQTYTCDYSSADGTQNLTLQVRQGVSAETFLPAGTVFPIEGLGDQAYTSETGVHARFGTTEVVAANARSDAQAAALIRALAAALASS